MMQGVRNITKCEIQYFSQIGDTHAIKNTTKYNKNYQKI